MAVEGKPKISRTPLEALENDGTVQPPLFSQYYAPVVCGLLAFVGVVGANWAVKRPVWSGLQNHVLLTAAGAAIGKFLDDYRNQYYAERDAIFRHYIQLHPEDFPPFESKLIKDVFEPWAPIR